MLKCTHCEKQFRYKSELARHERSHFPQFECNVCDKTFSFLSALRRHQKQHKRTGKVQCEQCERSFRDETLLQRHIKYAHTGSSVCPTCNLQFSSKVALQYHAKTHKPVSERKYRCSFEDCGKAFNFLHHLNHHELTHTNSKQHFCKKCGKGFIQLHHLKRHMLTHEPNNWFVCNVGACSKKFSTDLARKRHMASHSNLPDSDLTQYHKPVINIPNKDNTHSAPCSPDKTLSDSFDIQSDLYTPTGSGNRYVDSGVNFNDDYKCYTDLNKSVNDDNEIRDDCLWIKSNIDENCNALSDTAKRVTSPVIIEALNYTDKQENACVGCKCESQLVVNKSNSNCHKNNMPQLEYRVDGIVKLGETVDVDIVEKINTKYDAAKKENKSKFIPFNSCKAVLGNCIVSGNDTMGEGCLCAKMMDDDQHTEQEMDEITPIGLII